MISILKLVSKEQKRMKFVLNGIYYVLNGKMIRIRNLIGEILVLIVIL